MATHSGCSLRSRVSAPRSRVMCAIGRSDRGGATSPSRLLAVTSRYSVLRYPAWTLPSISLMAQSLGGGGRSAPPATDAMRGCPASDRYWQSRARVSSQRSLYRLFRAVAGDPRSPQTVRLLRYTAVRHRTRASCKIQPTSTSVVRLRGQAPVIITRRAPIRPARVDGLPRWFGH